MHAAPFSRRRRGFLLESLPDGYGFAFNFEEPSGVKLLHPVLYRRLEKIGNLSELSSASPEIRSAVAELSRNPHSTQNVARLTVWLHVINGCNFACHYCYIPHLSRFVSREEIQKHSVEQENINPVLSNLIGYCRDEGIPDLHITFAGGEPTLNLPLVEAFCREASERNNGVRITFGMISNGSFNFDELAPLVKRYDISVSLSADGYEDSHDRIRFELSGRQRVGSWKKLSKNVDLLVGLGIFPYFLYTVTPSNYRHISDFASYAHGKRLGFRLSLVRTRIAPTSAIQMVMAEELSRMYRVFAETLDPELPILRYASFAEWNLYRKKYTPCTSCRKYFAIDASGNVASCQMRMDRTYGNVVSEQFSAIVSRVRSDPVNVTLSNPEARQGTCVMCEFFHVCASGCPQHNLQAIGVMDHPSPWCHVYGTVLPEYIRAVARQLQRAVLHRRR